MKDIEACLVEIAQGSMTSLQRLYQELHRPIYALLLSIVKNEPLAEDLPQETFITVYNKAHLYRPGTNGKAWVYRIARNLAYDALRKAKHAAQLQMDLADGGALPDSRVEGLELICSLLELDAIDRQIVVLHAVGGFKHREIAEFLGTPHSTVRWRYRKALSKLAAILGGEHDDEQSIPDSPCTEERV